MNERLQTSQPVEAMPANLMDSVDFAEPIYIPQEVDARTSDGIHVRLLCEVETDSFYVTVDDERNHAFDTFEVKEADALDAFKHPYAYLAHLGIRG